MVAVLTTNDAVLENPEEFYARATQFNSRVSVFESSASIHIQDNDGKDVQIHSPNRSESFFVSHSEVSLSFESDSYVVDEDRGPVVVCISREGEISETLAIQVSTSEMEPLEAKG